MSSTYDQASNQPSHHPQPYQYLSRPEFRSPTGLAWATVIGLGILAFGYLVEAGTGVGQILDPKMILAENEADQTSVWIGIQGLSAMFRLLVYLGTTVLFLLWLSRSHSNLRALRATRVEHSAGWAIGWWFVPIANLFKPFQVVREVWRESDPEFDELGGVAPMNDGSAPLSMSLWWLFWLLSNFATNAAWRLTEAKFADLDQILGVMFLIAGTLSLAAAILAIVVVREISQRQLFRVQALAALPPQDPYFHPVSQPPAPPTF